MHLITRQTNTVVNEIATLDSAHGSVGVEDIGRPFLDRRFWKEPREHVRATRD